MPCPFAMLRRRPPNNSQSKIELAIEQAGRSSRAGQEASPSGITGYPLTTLPVETRCLLSRIELSCLGD
jgi:hypothetical protein